MSKKSSNLLRSNSYYNLLRPYLNDCQKYATCPPINLQQLQPSSSSSSRVVNNAVSTCSNTNSNANTMRAFNFNVNPLWRHNKLQQFELQRRDSAKHTARASASNSHKHKQQQKWQHQHCCQYCQQHVKSKQYSNAKKTTAATALCKNDLLVVEANAVAAAPTVHSTLVLQQNSLPLFEVLPRLWEATTAATTTAMTTENLLYQNSYLLDGVKYDYNTNSSQRHPSGKLSLNYMNFLKNITTSSKPSDRDIIFGNAKILFGKTRGWEVSRIEWLLELERRQEYRRRQHRQRLHKKSQLSSTKQSTSVAFEQNIANAVDDDDNADAADDSVNSMLNLCCFPFSKNAILWRTN